MPPMDATGEIPMSLETHKRVQHGTLAQGQKRSHDDAHEMLGLQARVVGNGRFTSRSAPAGDDFRERFIQGETPQAARLPLPEVFGHGLFAERLAEEHPRLVFQL